MQKQSNENFLLHFRRGQASQLVLMQQGENTDKAEQNIVHCKAFPLVCINALS